MTLVQIKTVWQKHEFDEYLYFMYKEFRFMVNEAIRIGHRLGLKTRNDFQQALYRRLKSDGMYAKYVQRALDVALRLLRQHRTVLKKNPNAKLPYMKKAMLELDCQFYCIRDGDDDDGVIRIPLCLGEYIHIPLQRHMLERINGMKTGSIRITPGRLYISYSKIVKPVAEPSGWVGLDLNEENITAHDSLGNTTVFDIGRIRKAREKYVYKTSRFKRNDVRKRRKVTEKYGAKQKNRTDDVLHKVALFIILSGFGVIMEDLTGIRKMYRKGNDQGSRFRGRMNAWPFYRLRKFIEYKAGWEGLPVIFVHAHGTSSRCTVCSNRLAPQPGRKMYCNTCDTLADCDANASRNILFRGLRTQARLGASEAMMPKPSFEEIRLVDVCSMRKTECLHVVYA